MAGTIKLAAMKFLAQLKNIAVLVKSPLHLSAVSRMVQLTISHSKSKENILVQ
jgi:hypothetical protein